MGESAKMRWCKARVSGSHGLNDLRGEQAIQGWGDDCGKVRDRAERTTRIGGIRAGMGMKELRSPNENYQQHAHKRHQDPEALRFDGTELRWGHRFVNGVPRGGIDRINGLLPKLSYLIKHSPSRRTN